MNNRITDITNIARKHGAYNKVLCLKFDSMTDLMRIKTESDLACFSHNRYKIKSLQTERSYNSSSWFGRGCNTFDQVFKKLNDGWPNGTKDIKQRAERIISPFRVKVKRTKRTLRYTDQGDEVITQAILSGNLDKAWRAKIRHPKIQRVEKAEIFLQPSGLAYVTSDQLFNQCATALALTFFLTTKRVQTKIIAASYAGSVDISGNTNILILVNLKNFTNKLNVEQLAINSWAGVFRTLYFLARCCTDIKISTGLGSTIDVSSHPYILPRSKNPSIKRYIVPRTTTPEMGKNYIEQLIKQGDL